MNCLFNSEFHRRAGRVGFIDDNLRYKNPLFRVVCDLYEGKRRFFEGATRDQIFRVMERGENLSIVPGGFQDATWCEWGKDRTVISNRKGLIKYCLQYGYSLTPIYTF